ncbi:uncharacterized protein J8A68_005573 [[Candida] subhashii]|uniref:Uncharacterized protein n=1 Tax=[Candida] subhashii TaxID=561895 RepID=A0A8J5QE87_9ASCO|nr:uncharacterized protein J8A68_005573 [[Candida] subhashii]KAG7660898.1 hypothetical protein J8A68_005573 [[Candida] subhashii]
MDKYGDLPDIEKDAQEIFETSDVESDIEYASPQEIEQTTPTELNVDNLPSEAKGIFSNSHISGNRAVDFSGSIHNQLYDSGYYVAEVEETVDEKLSRIARELEEIKLEKDMMITPETTTETNKLLQLLNNLKKSEPPIRSEILSSEQLRIDGIFNQIKQQQDVQSISRIKDGQEGLISLEDRLSSIEKLIGEDVLLEVGKKPISSIQKTLNDLERKISIVNNPEYNFENVTKQLDTLNKEMDKMEMRKKLFNLTDIYDIGGSKDDNSKDDNSIIDSLVEKLPEIKKNNEIIPLILKRLKTLNNIHNDMNINVELSKNMDQIITDLKIDIKNWDNSINQIYENIENYSQNFENNSKAMQTRLEQLSLKIEALDID